MHPSALLIIAIAALFMASVIVKSLTPSKTGGTPQVRKSAALNTILVVPPKNVGNFSKDLLPQP
jgi:hypothetical protein